jgi:hypothetical protein
MVKIAARMASQSLEKWWLMKSKVEIPKLLCQMAEVRKRRIKIVLKLKYMYRV